MRAVRSVGEMWKSFKCTVLRITEEVCGLRRTVEAGERKSIMVMH